MTLSEFEALAVPSTGLVPMVIRRAFGPYPPNSIAGFPPATAKAHYEDHTCDLMNEKRSAVDEPRVPGKPIDHNKTGLEIPIPPEWETQHPLIIISTAQKIKGKDWRQPDDMPLEDYAKHVVREEIEKRKNAAAA